MTVDTPTTSDASSSESGTDGNETAASPPLVSPAPSSPSLHCRPSSTACPPAPEGTRPLAPPPFGPRSSTDVFNGGEPAYGWNGRELYVVVHNGAECDAPCTTVEGAIYDAARDEWRGLDPPLFHRPDGASSVGAIVGTDGGFVLYAGGETYPGTYCELFALEGLAWKSMPCPTMSGRSLNPYGTVTWSKATKELLYEALTEDAPEELVVFSFDPGTFDWKLRSTLEKPAPMGPRGWYANRFAAGGNFYDPLTTDLSRGTPAPCRFEFELFDLPDCDGAATISSDKSWGAWPGVSIWSAATSSWRSVDDPPGLPHRIGAFATDRRLYIWASHDDSNWDARPGSSGFDPRGYVYDLETGRWSELPPGRPTFSSLVLGWSPPIWTGCDALFLDVFNESEGPPQMFAYRPSSLP